MDVNEKPDENLNDFAQEYHHTDGEEKLMFPAINMRELMGGDYHISFLCRGVLAEGQPAIIGGPMKAFKTTLALELAVCLATGRPFLNHFEVPEQTKVCFFSGEGGLAVIQDTLRRIGESIDVDIAGIENLIVTDRVPKLDDPRHLKAVGEYIKTHNPAVAFFDPLYLALSGADVGNVFSMGNRFGALNELCLPMGVTPILLHHNKKSRVDPYSPAGLEDLSQSGLAEYAAQWLLLARRTAYDADDPVHRLWVTIGGRAGHGSAWGLDVTEGTVDDPGGRVWQPELRRQDEVRGKTHGQQAQRQIEKEKAKQAEFESLASRAYAWMTGKTDGVTCGALRAMFRIGAAKADQIVTFLEESGSIEQCYVEVRTGKSTRKTAGFRTATNDGEQENFA